MTYLYIYRVKNDTGFAPCIDNNLLTLACCKGGKIRNGKVIKTGLRYIIGAKKNGVDYENNSVYVLGTYDNKLLYLAKITDVITMLEYYNTIGKARTDGIYSVENGILVRNEFLQDKNIHTSEESIKRDIAGEYVLISNDFLYLGKDAVFIDIVKEKNPNKQETKTYQGKEAEEIIKICLKYKDTIIHKPNNNSLNENCQC